MARRHRELLSVEWVKLELLRTAYATRGGLFARMDPRMVLLWYVVMAFAPWFTHNVTVLAGLFALGAMAVALARVGPLVLGLFLVGLGFEVLYLFGAALFFGGTTDTLLALMELNLKLGAVSMFSMAAFVSLDPEKLSDAMLALRAPQLVAFGVSYGYRMLPILVEEYNTVFDGYRLRLAPPESAGLLGWRTVAHWGGLVVRAFYPMMLNTAVSVRTTVEALEARGFTRAGQHEDARRLRLSSLQVRPLDVWVLTATLVAVVAAYAVGQVWPVHR